MIASEDPEVQKRAHYRLGLIQSENTNLLDSAMSNFEKVSEIDAEFCKHQVSLRIAEILYQQDKIDEAQARLAKIEG